MHGEFGARRAKRDEKRLTFRSELPNVDPDTGVRDTVVPDKILRPYREGTFSLYPQKTWSALPPTSEDRARQLG